MKLKKCFFCNKLRFVPYHVTEIHPDGTIESYDMCKTCGWEYVKDAYEDTPQKRKEPDLTEIKTPLDLLSFLMGSQKSPKKPNITCECGMTDKELQKHNKFGCPKCYDVFHEFMEKLVFPYHGASEHVGKLPKHQLQRPPESLEDKIKLLKLKLAKAVETEKYEKAAEINAELKDLISLQQLPTTSDQ